MQNGVIQGLKCKIWNRMNPSNFMIIVMHRNVDIKINLLSKSDWAHTEHSVLFWTSLIHRNAHIALKHTHCVPFQSQPLCLSNEYDCICHVSQYGSDLFCWKPEYLNYVAIFKMFYFYTFGLSLPKKKTVYCSTHCVFRWLWIVSQNITMDLIFCGRV